MVCVMLKGGTITLEQLRRVIRTNPTITIKELGGR